MSLVVEHIGKGYAAELPNSRGGFCSRVTFRGLFPDDDAYKFEGNLVKPDSWYWTYFSVPLSVEYKGKIEIVLFSVKSVARRLGVEPRIVRQAGRDEVFENCMRDRGLQLSIPALNLQELQLIQAAHKERKAPPIPKDSLISKIEIGLNHTFATITEWRYDWFIIKKMNRIWDYSRGGFTNDKPASLDLTYYFETGKYPFTLSSHKKRGLAPEDIQTITETIQKKYTEVYPEVVQSKASKSWEISLPSRFSCTAEIRRDGSIEVRWKGYVVESRPTCALALYKWNYLTGGRDRTDIEEGKTYRQNISEYLQERADQIQYLFSTYFPKLDCKTIAETIQKEYPNPEPREITVGATKIEFTPLGQVLLSAPPYQYEAFDLISKTSRPCVNPDSKWDYFANEYTFCDKPENHGLVQENLKRGGMSFSAAKAINDYLIHNYTTLMTRVSKEKKPATIRAVTTILPSTLYVKLDGNIYAKLKEKNYPHGSTRKAKNAIDLSKGRSMKRLVANLSKKTPKEREEIIRSFQYEYDLLTSLAGTRGIIEVYDLVIGTNHKNEPTVTLYEQNCRLGELYKKKNLSLAQQHAIITDILYGIKTLHEKKITHRDIKPCNIVLDSPDSVLTPTSSITAALIDFSEPSGAFGDHTIRYLSPEKARAYELYEDKKPYTWTPEEEAQSDLWSFGAALYETFISHTKLHRHTLAERGALTIESLFPAGAPNEADSVGFLTYNLLQMEPKNRWSAAEALDWSLVSWYGVEKGINDGHSPSSCPKEPSFSVLSAP